MINLSIVVPVYNEVESVEALCASIEAAVAGLGRTYEVVLIDDGSTDGTWEKLKALSAVYPRLKLVRFRTNFGQTAAMSAGFRESSGEIVITLDADLQNDPADIPLLLERLEQGFDVVSGWRRDRQDTYINRKLPSMLANRLISRMTGVALHDYGCTLKAYRREIVKDIHLYGEMHRFIPALCRWVGGRIDEVPVRHHARQFGTSKYGISRTTRVVLDLLTVKFILHYSRGPMQIFGRIGLWLGVPGMLMLTGMVIAHLSFMLFGSTFGADLVKRPFWVMTSFMLIFFGIQFVSMGLLAEIQIRTWYESQGRPTYAIKEIVEPREVVSRPS